MVKVVAVTGGRRGTVSCGIGPSDEAPKASRVGNEEGCPPPQPTRESGELRDPPPRRSTES